uniref:Penicillin-binding protein 1B n=1 Tax=Candidatus Kentrum sp. LPFa TaxID=2126335 RepID=A0A450WCV0_9GAMM|nr:MAG: penicillin-binding protein 1B [Candidatus Kentron sp. LPFa]VFK30557.1 MAG: penicillin-binding protein 1B [Candidatus Kentron sp. LPFa]
MVRESTPGHNRHFFSALGWRLAIFVVVFLTGYLTWVDLTIRAEFKPTRWAVPAARLYARPLTLYVGKPLAADEFEEDLGLAGYHEEERLNRPGSYRRRGQHFSVIKRSFSFWDGRDPATRIELRFRDGYLASLQDRRGKKLVSARIEPGLIGRIYPTHQEDRIPVTTADVPPRLIEALIAVEDRSFYHHFGISLRAIARAAYKNIRSGATMQGGSTLTQQLVKNYFLGPERSFSRKLQEMAFALLLEARYEKDDILRAYLNEIYLGQQGRHAIHGFGSAARFYFHRPLAELRLPEVALLVALARGASYYNPRRHPKRALERRNLVIDVMLEWGYINAREAAVARSQPLAVTKNPPPGTTPFPGFVGLVRRQIARDFHLKDLRSEGLRIFTTLDMRIQRKMERAIVDQLPLLEKRVGIPRKQLQVASIVTDAENGRVLALVGGRDPSAVGFNRALNAVRPIGSLIKPAVYLTALERHDKYTLASILRDERIRIRRRKGNFWSPKNYDRKAHGRVPLITALANSYNLATVRLGMALGLSRISKTIGRLGVKRRIPLYPSTLLGAAALSPLEVAEMYQTIASGGLRMPSRSVLAITDAQGTPLNHYGASVTPAFDSGPMFLLTHALQAAMRSGTGRAIYDKFDQSLGFAGKTGTTNGLRDSWFAGFSQDRLAVVWLGLDNNGPTGLTGAGGALALWGNLMKSMTPQPRKGPTPSTVAWHWTDLHRGARTDPGCPRAKRIPYIKGSAPPYSPCE